MEKLTKLLQRAVDQQGIPGLAVGVVRNQELVWSRGFGYANRDVGHAPTEDTIFRVASITKTFTATAILQLRDEGRLDLDDPLIRHIPEFSAARPIAAPLEGVTLRRMLAHHSGLTTESPLPCWETLEFPTREELLDAFPQIGVVIPQDSAFKYSNLAFGLLGEVILRVSGRPFHEYIQSTILDPLEMTSSSLDHSDSNLEHLATGYLTSRYEDEPTPAPNVRLNAIGACGQLHSSVSDLAKWIALQFRVGGRQRDGSQVLCGTSIEESHCPQYLEPDWSTGYCLGWRATRVADNVLYGHGGGIHGYSSQILFSKRHQVGVICLANVWPHRGVYELAIDSLETILKDEDIAAETVCETRRTSTLPEFRKLLGQYETMSEITVQVVYRDGKLRLDSRIDDYQLHAPAILEPEEGADCFVVRGGRGSGESVAFNVTDDGQTVSFELGGFRYRKQNAHPNG